MPGLTIRNIMMTIATLVLAAFGLVAIGVAGAAYLKSKDPIVLRGGYFEDYMKLSVFAAGTGIVFLGGSGGLGFVTVRGWLRKPPAQDSHF